MLNNLKYKLGVVAVGLLLTLTSSAQINTYSPYSRYGVGEMVNSGFGATRAMGNIGIGRRAKNQINFSNPASYTSQDTMTFLFDFGLNGTFSDYKTSEASKDYLNYTFDHIAIAFPITRWLKASVGVAPYSTTGYNLVTREYSENIGMDQVSVFAGEGGLNQFFLGGSIEFLDHFSIGANMYYTFGNVKHTKDYYLDTTFAYMTRNSEDISMKGLAYSIGIQHYYTFSNNFFYNIGVTVESDRSLNTTRGTIMESMVSGVSVDTIQPYEEETFDSKVVPMTIGVGFNVGIKDVLSVGLDYYTQDWSSVKPFNVNNSYKTQNSIRFGAEYIPDMYSVTSYLKRVNYRMGAYYTDSYVKINGESVKNYGITFGVGIPVKNPYNQFNIAVDLGRRGTTNNGLVEENYAMLSLSFTFYDIWFVKRKYH